MLSFCLCMKPEGVYETRRYIQKRHKITYPVFQHAEIKIANNQHRQKSTQERSLTNIPNVIKHPIVRYCYTYTIIHAREKSYKCDMCVTKSWIDTHSDAGNYKNAITKCICIHTGEEPYECDILKSISFEGLINSRNVNKGRIVIYGGGDFDFQGRKN